MEGYVAKLEPGTVIIQRRHILSSVFRAVQEPDFDFHRPLTVIFSGEDATDEGGPTREFFRLQCLLKLYLLYMHHTIVLFTVQNFCKTRWKKSFFGSCSYNVTYNRKIIARRVENAEEDSF